MAEKARKGRYLLQAALGRAGCPFAAIALFAAFNTVLTSGAAEAAIKPPPVILENRNGNGYGSAIPFKPVRLVYRQSEGEGFGKPTGVFVERETGEVLVTDGANNLVTLLTKDGVPLYTFGYNGEVVQPTKAVVDKQGRILVLAGVPRKVKVFSYRGEPLGDFRFPGLNGAGAQVVPTAMSLDGAGNLYIADSTSGRILVYDPQDQLVTSFGKRGEEPGAFLSVTAIAVDPSGTICVADARHEPAIQLFDSRGKYLRGWGDHSGGPHNVSLPGGIALSASGLVLVADTIRQTVAAFTPEGRFLYRFGGLGSRPGNLAFPSDLAVDGEGRLYVTETANARLQVFEPAGEKEMSRLRNLPPATSEGVRDAVRQGVSAALRTIVR